MKIIKFFEYKKKLCIRLRRINRNQICGYFINQDGYTPDYTNENPRLGISLLTIEEEMSEEINDKIY